VNRLILGVVLPLVFQLLFVAAIIAATNGTGSFVGLAAMLLGLAALPLTAILNWSQVRSQPGRPAPQLAVRIFWITAIFPALILFLYAVAS